MAEQHADDDVMGRNDDPASEVFGNNALDRRDGRRIWDYPSAGCGPMTVRRGQIHFVSAVEDGLVIALDQRTGEEAWRISGLRSCSSFTLIGDTGYIQTNDGAVRAISLAVR